MDRRKFTKQFSTGTAGVIITANTKPINQTGNGA
jgi:hypothetical protein